jgi:osmotically inducible protein OsmC
MVRYEGCLARRSEMPVRTARARWEGDLKQGNGNVRVGTGYFDGAYSYPSRFEEGAGTNPEELIGAAHAGCFSMALSGVLGKAGFNPRHISTEAKVHLDKMGDGFRITKIELKTEADVPGIEQDAFAKHAQEAKQGCPVSQALSGTEIVLSAELVKF